MKVFLTIIICKLLRFVGALLGKGSSKPGQIALRICPDILTRITLPDKVIAVTGSNGKTSTVGMIHYLLTKSGYSVAYNREGSNQLEGVTTMILSNVTLSGKMKKDILLIESDERYARYTFRYIKPTHYVFTNLYRDQLTRNGHPEWVYEALADSVFPGMKLILNADDPLVSCFSAGAEDVVWFGVNDITAGDNQITDTVYDDGAYCPLCKAPMKYTTRHYNHIGIYECTACSHRRHDPDYAVTAVDLKNKKITVDGKYEITLSLDSLFNVYNLLAAYTVARLVGIEGKDAAENLSRYVLKNGRAVRFSIGEGKGMLLAAKHENSVAYDLCISVARNAPYKSDVMIIVDEISRKYFTTDTSWLWDIDFEYLNDENIGRVILAGKYVNDLMVRFSCTDIDISRVECYEDLADAAEALRKGGNFTYVLTCFVDEKKFLKLVTAEEGQA